MASVLIVDDNEQNLYMLATLMRGHGHDVMTAANGSEALGLARKQPPDIVVTDILMPEMDGFTLCRHWKSDEVLKQKPLVFYTASYTDPRDQQLGLNLGADQFVCKPSKPDELVDALESVLDRRSMGDPQPPNAPEEDETGLLRQYNDALVRQLQDKVDALEEANRQLQQRVAELDAAQEGLRIRDRALAAIPTGILITDPHQPDNPLISCNEAFESITGYSRDEVIGRNCRFLNGSQRDQEGLDEIRAAMNEQRGCQVVLQNFRRDGSAFWNRLTIAPVVDAEGQLTHYVGVQEDITARREARESLRKNEALLRTITNQIPQALLVVDDRTAAVEFFNVQFLRLWNIEHLAPALQRGELTDREIMGSCLPLVSDGQEFLRVLQSFEHDTRGMVIDDELELFDGRTIRTFCTRMSDDTGEYRGRLYLFEDITARKQAERLELERTTAMARLDTLSHREREVLDLLVLGKPNKVIAAELHISGRTVEKHRASLMKKLRMNNVPDLVRLRITASPHLPAAGSADQ